MLGIEASELALAGGEDYGLILSVPAHSLNEVQRLGKRLNVVVHEVGRFERGEQGVYACKEGRLLPGLKREVTNISKMKARILELLEQVRNGAIQPEAALEQLKFLPFEDIGIARVDTHRELRQGFPELIYGKDKDFESIQRIVEAMYGLPSPVLVTRLSPFKASRLLKAFPDAQYFPKARILRLNERYIRPQNLGPVGLVSAGTSDGPVLEEACITLETLGVKTEVLLDVGVAGVHRLFPEIERLQACRVLIAIAGMEGASGEPGWGGCSKRPFSPSRPRAGMGAI